MSAMQLNSSQTFGLLEEGSSCIWITSPSVGRSPVVLCRGERQAKKNPTLRKSGSNLLHNELGPCMLYGGHILPHQVGGTVKLAFS